MKWFKLLVISSFCWSPAVFAGGDMVKGGKAMYTDFSDPSFCRDLSEGGDSWEVLCKGVPGYKIRMMGFDSLMPTPDPTAEMSLELPGGKQIGLWNDLSKHAIKGGKSRLTNKKIEWRYIKKGRSKLYYALVFRVYTGKKSKLFVARLDGAKSCLIGATGSNEKARKIADNLSQPCIR